MADIQYVKQINDYLIKDETARNSISEIENTVNTQTNKINEVVSTLNTNTANIATLTTGINNLTTEQDAIKLDVENLKNNSGVSMQYDATNEKLTFS